MSLACQGQPFLLPLKQLLRPGPLLRDSSAISASLSCAGNASDTESSLVFLSCTGLQQGCALLVLWGMLCASSTVALLHSFICSRCSRPYSRWLFCLFFAFFIFFFKFFFAKLHFSYHIDSSCLFIHRIGTAQAGCPHPLGPHPPALLHCVPRPPQPHPRWELQP